METHGDVITRGNSKVLEALFLSDTSTRTLWRTWSSNVGRERGHSTLWDKEGVMLSMLYRSPDSGRWSCDPWCPWNRQGSFHSQSKLIYIWTC